MRELLTPWGYALRGLVLRAPQGPRTPATPVPPPPGLEPPEPLPDAGNGYLALAALVRDWPAEGRVAPDLDHRRKVLPADRAVAERALAPLRSLLEGVDGPLSMPAWQVPVNAEGTWPELPAFRRLVQALLLRGELEGRRDDRDRAIDLARRLRRAQGPFMHCLVGLAMERSAEGEFEGLEEDRAAAVRWELARHIVPNAHRTGPWEPVAHEPHPAWTDARRAVAWALSGHPAPYDPSATVADLVAERDLMAAGDSAALRRRADEVGRPWPPGMCAPNRFGPGQASLPELWRARKALREVENPYGRLEAALTLRAAAGLA